MPRSSTIGLWLLIGYALSQGLRGMVFRDLERPAAMRMLGCQAHDEAANALLSMLA